jgi:NAD(P)-dependent dehydrogenase (short-subunit alcohol dehydrogenase family)
MKRIAVITGTTHGIGRVSARELTKAGLTVVMLCRDVAAAQKVRDDILGMVPDGSVHVFACDLASLQSVHDCALAVRTQFPHIDLLINNAGTVCMSHRMSMDGFELTFATNHLGPFLLTELLRPHIRAQGRIVNVASVAHFRGQMRLNAITNPRARYRNIEAYAQSKLANVLHTFALARRMNGAMITVNCLHPGIVASHLLPWWVRIPKRWITPTTFDNERGAYSTLKLTLSDDVDQITGQYFDEQGVVQTASALARDVALQETLWRMSEQWTARWRDNDHGS